MVQLNLSKTHFDCSRGCRILLHTILRAIMFDWILVQLSMLRVRLTFEPKTTALLEYRLTRHSTSEALWQSLKNESLMTLLEYFDKVPSVKFCPLMGNCRIVYYCFQGVIVGWFAYVTIFPPTWVFNIVPHTSLAYVRCFLGLVLAWTISNLIVAIYTEKLLLKNDDISKLLQLVSTIDEFKKIEVTNWLPIHLTVPSAFAFLFSTGTVFWFSGSAHLTECVLYIVLPWILQKLIADWSTVVQLSLMLVSVGAAESFSDNLDSSVKTAQADNNLHEAFWIRQIHEYQKLLDALHSVWKFAGMPVVLNVSFHFFTAFFMCLWALHGYRSVIKESSLAIIVAAYFTLVAFEGIVPVAMLTDKCHGFHHNSIRARAAKHVLATMRGDTRVAYDSFLQTLDTAPCCIHLPVFGRIDSRTLKYYGIRITMLLPTLYVWFSGVLHLEDHPHHQESRHT